MQNCFFFHNPKAGGSSIRDAFARLFPAAEIAPPVELVPAIYGCGAGESLSGGKRLYMGHYGYDLYQRVATDHAMITNFRHPATRVLSLYNYFRHSVPDTLETRTDERYFAVRLAKTAEFEKFVMSEDERVTTYIMDHHFRQLAGSGWSMSAERDFDAVCDLIDNMAWYYVCEYPVLSVRWGRSVLGAADFSISSTNVTPVGPHVTASVLGISDFAFDRVLEINQRDLAIYAHGLARFFSEIRDLSRRAARRWAPANGDHASPAIRMSQIA